MLFNTFLSLIFPDPCSACNKFLAKGEKIICTQCRFDLPYTNYHVHPNQNPLYYKFAGMIPLTHALAYLKFTKKGKVQKILHALKYNNYPEIGTLMGQLYGHILQQSEENYTDFDIILPVPLHPSRQRSRGYNQSAYFAKGLSESLQVPFSETVIQRTKKTETQTKKGKLDRWENVTKIFAVKEPQYIQQQAILLVDDVVTTGATLQACLKILQQYGAKELSIAAIAEAS